MESFGSIIHPKEKLTITQVLGAANDVFREFSLTGVVAQQWKNGRLIYQTASPATGAVVLAKQEQILIAIREKIQLRYQQQFPPTKLVGRF